MSQHELDRAITEIRDEQLDEKVVREAAGQVFSRIFDSAYITAPSVDRIRSCADMQALIPAYLSRQLPSARALLVEDHTLHCVECRRVLQQQRFGTISDFPLQTSLTRGASRKPVPVLAWALAASLIIGITVGVTGALHGLLPGQHAVRATVENVQGTLYRISDIGSTLVEAGQVIRNADELRTAKGSRAILRLVSGARVELAERSDVSVSGAWRGDTVNLERGQMIVQASDPAQKVFYVMSGDVIIPVRNGVLAVNHGVKGSRVAMARGTAQVEQGPKRFALAAGEQVATEYPLTNVPIASEFAWSQNADQYLALLNELSGLRKSFQAIPTPGLRYSPSLAQYLPANTTFYAAIPNLGGAIAEAKRIFDDRLASSDLLREWWQKQPASQTGEFDQMLNQVSSISQYLGDEIVVALASTGTQHQDAPVFLAQLHQSGLADYLHNNLPANSGIQIIENGSAVNPASASKGQLFVDVANNILVASPDAGQLNRIEQLVQKSGAGQFTATPFFARIDKAYQAGVGYLLAADLEQMISKSVKNAKEVPPGFSNVQYLVLEKRDISGSSEIRAALAFAGERQGVASWLAAPGPMGSLNFVSPEASFAASLVMKSPRAMMQELINYGSNADSRFTESLSAFESKAGVNLLDDVAAPLGNDVTFAIDGALLPIPAWKIAIEVYDPARLQQTLSTFVDRFNQQAPIKTGKLLLTSETVNGRTFYSLQPEKTPGLAAYYTFVDGYLLAGPSEANLLQAIENKQSGHTLVSSPSFQSQLPADGYTNFSSVIYSNFGSSLSAIAGQVKGTVSLTPAQQQSLAALTANNSPILICLYGEPDRIIAAGKGSFLGFNLGTLAGIGQGKPLIPLIASSAGMARAQTGTQQRRQ